MPRVKVRRERKAGRWVPTVIPQRSDRGSSLRSRHPPEKAVFSLCVGISRQGHQGAILPKMSELGQCSSQRRMGSATPYGNWGAFHLRSPWISAQVFSLQRYGGQGKGCRHVKMRWPTSSRHGIQRCFANYLVTCCCLFLSSFSGVVPSTRKSPRASSKLSCAVWGSKPLQTASAETTCCISTRWRCGEETSQVLLPDGKEARQKARIVSLDREGAIAESSCVRQVWRPVGVRRQISSVPSGMFPLELSTG